LWARNTDFISADGKQAMLDSPEVRAALRAYYSLYQYMPHDPTPDTEEDVTDFFFDRRVAAIATGAWMLQRERYRQLPADQLDLVRTALLPGPSFVGGIHLVIWTHVESRTVDVLMDLIRYLSDSYIQLEYAQRMGMLPSRFDLLQQPPFSTDPRLQVFVKAMEGGRSHASIPMWGMLEDKISLALTGMWSSIKQNPRQDLDELISAQLGPLADRLSTLLSK
jgi:multiple sugar transport system substrate-binding protein